MVNKKLSLEDEELIYHEWLAGKQLTAISKKFPVVISTVQRVIKKKSRQDGKKRNIIVSSVLKHIKNAESPMTYALKMFESNDECLHDKQKQFIHESLDNITMLVNKLKQSIEALDNDDVSTNIKTNDKNACKNLSTSSTIETDSESSSSPIF